MQGVILAAGKGSRLHPITTRRSKAMLPILGQPIVERVMEAINANGVDDFILVVSEDDADIVSYFENESRLEAKIRFVTQKERRGMADALSKAAPLIGGPFILSACDNLVSPEHVAELMACYQRYPGSAGVLSLMEVDESLLGRTGLVEMYNGLITRIVEKPAPEEAPSNIASLPLYVFEPALLDYLPHVPLSPRGEYELQDAVQMLIDSGGTVRGVFTHSRLQLTGPRDLLAINRHYLLTGGDRPQLAPYTVGKNTHLITPLRIEDGTVIGEDCIIGPCVYIERNCHVEAGAIIKDAVVLRGAKVPAGATVVGKVVS